MICWAALITLVAILGFLVAKSILLVLRIREEFK